MSYQPDPDATQPDPDPTTPAGEPTGDSVATSPFASPPPPPAAPPKSSNTGRNVAIAIAAVLGVAAIGLAVWAFGLRGDVDDRDSTIEQLTNEKADLEEQVSDLEDGQGGTQAELEAAQASVDSLTEELATANSDLATTQTALDDALAQVSDLEAELEAAQTTTTTTTTTEPATTVPPDTEAPVTAPPFDPNNPQEDGIVSPEEFAVIVPALGTAVPAGFTVEQGQDVATRACASVDSATLTDVVLYVQATYLPAGSTFDAGSLTGGMSAAACYTHVQTLTGG
jgi:hypothetical protein